MRIIIAVVVVGWTVVSWAAPAGFIVKGVANTWEEVAKLALRVSGRAASEESIGVAAKTLRQMSAKYGDEVAEASLQGGVEIAEQTVRHGSAFAHLVGRARNLSPNGLREIALHADEMLQWTGRYGEGILRLNGKAPGLVGRAISVLEKQRGLEVARTIEALAKLPAEDIPRVIGALEKNPSVAGIFAEHLAKGGGLFVEKVFALNGRQIMAGTLGASAIVSAYSLTSPMRETGENVRKDGEKAREVVDRMSPDEQREWAERRSSANDERSVIVIRSISIAILVGLLGGVFAFVCGRSARAKRRVEGH